MKNPMAFKCPHCNQISCVDDSEIDANIERLRSDIVSITNQLSPRCKLTSTRGEEWRASAVNALEIKKGQLHDLRMKRHAMKQQIEKNKDAIFRALVKAALPFDEYVALCEKAETEAREYECTSSEC